MSEALRSVLLGTMGVAAAAGVAIVLTLSRGRVAADPMALRGAARIAALTTLAQCAHFTEELATGFPERFPELLGLAPWPPAFFAPFNLTWLFVWAASVRGLMARHPLAVAALWFLGIAGVVNGIAHPALAVASGGYFPGLVTSPLVGVAGVLLIRRLAALTRGRSAGRSPQG